MLKYHLDGYFWITLKDNILKSNFMNKISSSSSSKCLKHHYQRWLRYFLDRAAMITPWGFITTTPISTSFSSSNMALSKFAFTLPLSSGFHILLTGQTCFAALGRAFETQTGSHGLRRIICPRVTRTAALELYSFYSKSSNKLSQTALNCSNFQSAL